MALIRLEKVTVRFGDIVALDGVDLVVHHGETMAVLGPSACGKTTLLKTLAGLIKPDAGCIYFDNHAVTDLGPGERGVGMVFEGFALYPHLASRDNIAFPLRMRKAPDVDARVRATARRLGIDAEILLERRPAELAAGEQQRVALGRALVANPTILLMDEPMGMLDPQTRAQIRPQLSQLMDEFDITVIYVTQDQQEAMAVADRIAVMRQGRVVQIGTLGEVLQRPVNVFVAQFVGSPAMNILAGDVEGERLWVDDATASIPLPPVRRFVSDGPILVGIRPEHLRTDPDGVLLVEVGQIEPHLTQRVQIVYGEIVGSEPGRRAGQTLIAQVPAHTDVRVGQTLILTLDSRNIYLFDPHDETRIQ